jgi:hypothetical protein
MNTFAKCVAGEERSWILPSQVLILNGENYTTYDDLLRLHQFFMVGSVEAADPLCAQMIYQDQMG